MKKLITFLRNELPKDALEIQECIDLLNQCIGGSVEGVKIIINNAIDNRDYNKMSTLQEMLISIDTIQTKLEEYSNLLQLDTDVEDALIDVENNLDDEKDLPHYNALLVDPSIPYTLLEDYTFKRPAAFELFGTRHRAKDWKEIFVKTCEVLATKDAAIFTSFVSDKSMQGRKISYFCTDPKGIRTPRKIKPTNIYVMTNMSANQVRNVIERMLRHYGIKLNEYKIFLKADYTARHE